MYIAPNTNIRILANCPLDNTYDHTIYMLSPASQKEYFMSLTKYILPNQTYQRYSVGKMRVEKKAEDLYDCNYLMFQNSSFGDKWFYAFITRVTYVSNTTSEIEFELDVMQTWFFDYDLKPCFVEREHSLTDNVGDNLVPENLELGEYVGDDFDSVSEIAPLSIVIAATFDENYDDVGGGYYSNLFSGLHFIAFPNTTTGAAEAEEFILNAGSKSDGIVCVFLMPTAMITDTVATPKGYDISKNKSVSAIGNYTPKNKKLLTFPYNFLYVTNFQGNEAAYCYEYFTTSNCQFYVTGDMSCNPSCVLIPKNYKGLDINYDEKLTLSGYPQLGFNVDTFKAWLAQNGGALATNALSNALSMGTTGAVIGGAPAAMIGFGAGLATTVAQSLSQVAQTYLKPNQAKGSSGTQTLAAIGLLNFGFIHKHIRPEFARIIDDYFNMFGYATHRVKVPNRDGRPHWNFVQTKGCVIRGSMPNDDSKRVCEIYNKGITFWNHGDEVGNYDLDNSPQ